MSYTKSQMILMYLEDVVCIPEGMKETIEDNIDEILDGNVSYGEVTE